MSYYITHLENKCVNASSKHIDLMVQRFTGPVGTFPPSLFLFVNEIIM